MALPRDIQDIVEVFVLSNLSTLMSPNPFGNLSTVTTNTPSTTRITNT